MDISLIGTLTCVAGDFSKNGFKFSASVYSADDCDADSTWWLKTESSLEITSASKEHKESTMYSFAIVEMITTFRVITFLALLVVAAVTVIVIVTRISISSSPSSRNYSKSNNNRSVYNSKTNINALHEKCSYSEFFWYVFSCIRTEYGEILCIKTYIGKLTNLNWFH